MNNLNYINFKNNSNESKYFKKENDKFKIAIFAGGCFWKLQCLFNKIDGVLFSEVGYTGGNSANPDYNSVCFEDNHHAESIKIYYNDEKIKYEQLVKFFFDIHDATQLNRQGFDIGEQYRSEIFYLTDKQNEIAKKTKLSLINKGFKIKTQITKLKKFYIGEQYHQNYLKKRGKCKNILPPNKSIF